MSHYTQSSKTISCPQTIFVGNERFRVEEVLGKGDQREVTIMTPRRNKPGQIPFLWQMKKARPGERIEVLKGIFAVFKSPLKRSRLRLTIEAPCDLLIDLQNPKFINGQPTQQIESPIVIKLLFRTVHLPADVPGQLFLHGMPGRDEPFSGEKAKIHQAGIKRVVCLAPLDEILKKSPEYAHVIEQNTLPWIHEPFEIPDYHAPQDREAFLRLAKGIATRLHSGENILIHCGAGIGRTGTLAICVLLALGVTESEARKLVRAAGSRPERPSQEDIIQWVRQKAEKK